MARRTFRLQTGQLRCTGLVAVVIEIIIKQRRANTGKLLPPFFCQRNRAFDSLGWDRNRVIFLLGLFPPPNPAGSLRSGLPMSSRFHAFVSSHAFICQSSRNRPIAASEAGRSPLPPLHKLERNKKALSFRSQKCPFFKKGSFYKRGAEMW